MSDLVERKVVKLGRYKKKKIGDITYTNYYQWLTYDCGHTEPAYVDFAAWRVGSESYCDKCSDIKAELRKEVVAEFKAKLEGVV